MNWLLVMALAWAGTLAWAVTASLRLAEERIRGILAADRAESRHAREVEGLRQERAEAGREASRRIAALTAALDQAQAQARDTR